MSQRTTSKHQPAKSGPPVQRPKIRHIRTVRVTLTPLARSVPVDPDDDPRCLVSHETEAAEEHEVTSGGVHGYSSGAAGEPTGQSCFGRNETARVSPALLRAIDDCADFNGRGFFKSRRENRLAMLILAYLLLLELVSGGDAAIALAVERFPPDARVRRPSRTKPELIAVQLTAKPDSEPQRKLCSDYSSVLMVARVKGLSPADFVEWIEEADIGECKVRAKKIRAALKAGLTPEIDDELDATPPASTEEPWVQISHGRGQQVGGSYSATVPEMRLSPVADLIEAGVECGNLPSVLRMVADKLELEQTRPGKP